MVCLNWISVDNQLKPWNLWNYNFDVFSHCMLLSFTFSANNKVIIIIGNTIYIVYVTLLNIIYFHAMSENVLYLLVIGISVTYSVFDKYCLMLVDFLSVCGLKAGQMSYIWLEIYLF